MAGSRVPRDPAISPDLRRFLDTLARQQDTPSSVFSSTENGLAPLSGGGTTNFLRADGSWVAPVTLFKILAADETGQNVDTAQPWFPTAGGVTVEANSTYEFWGRLRITRAAGTTAHTTDLLFGGTATLTNIAWTAVSNSNDTVAPTDSTDISAASVATAVSMFDSSTSATEDKIAEVHGIVRINAAGTFIPQFQYSAPPGGAPTIQRNSYFMLRKLGAGDVTTQGTWA